MLAIPLEVSRCAKLLSPADDPMGTPSSRIWCPEAPSSTPLPPLSSSACRSSFHVVSNCAVVLAWPNSYSRANLGECSDCGQMPALRFVFQDSFRCFFLFKRSQVRSRPFQKSTIYISFPPASDTSLPVPPVLISITDFVVHLETFLPKPLPLGWASSSRPMTHGTSF